MSNNILIEKIEGALSQEKPESLISEFKFGENVENELLFFFKPECFLQKDTHHTRHIIEMVFEKLTEFEVDISGVLLLGGKCLDELSIMDRHYGFINKLSRNASQIISEKDLKKIKNTLSIEKLENHILIGGHEFLSKYKGFDEESLNNIWSSKKSFKLRSGFYFQQYNIKGDQFLLINGFHPSQLRWFTNPLHRIIIILLKSNTDWKILKNDLAGDTFPEKAREDSIRGELFKNKQQYGLQNVSISANCVHLSAGPIEALFEVDNFLKNVKSISFAINKTNVFRLMVKSGFKQEDVMGCLTNPTTFINGKQTDLFTLTEEMNSTEAIAKYRQYFLKQ